jgi:hypothetical protein
MHFEDFRTWHWMLIGLIAGALFSGVKMWSGPSYSGDNITDMEQLRFERGLIGEPAGGQGRFIRLTTQQLAGQPILRNVVVHPPIAGERSNSYWVTGQVCEVEPVRKDPKNPASEIWNQATWSPFRYEAKAPYQPLPANATRGRSTKAKPPATQKNGKTAAAAAAASQPAVDPAGAAAPEPTPAVMKYPTVVEYLKAMEKDSNAKFSYRYAWQEQRAALAVLPPLSGFLIIGVAWPMTLSLLVGAGLARKPQPRVKLPKRKAATAAKAVKDTTEGDKKLAELNAALEAEMAGFVGGAAVTGDADESRAGVVVKPLTAGAMESATAKSGEDEDVEVKDYGGEFYPVVRSTHIEHKQGDKHHGAAAPAEAEADAAPSTATATTEAPPAAPAVTGPPPSPAVKGPSAKAAPGTTVKVKVPLLKAGGASKPAGSPPPSQKH